MLSFLKTKFFKYYSEDSYFFQVIEMLQNDKIKLFKLIFIFLFVSLFDLFGIALIGPYVAYISNPDNNGEKLYQLLEFISFDLSHNEMIYILSIILIIVFFSKMVLGIYLNRVIINFSLEQQIKLKNQLMKKYQSMSYENLLARNSAEYIFAMNQLVNMYCGNVLIMALRMVIDGILILTILLLLFWFNPIPLIMLSLLFSLVYFGYEKVFGKRLKYLGEIFNQASHKLISLMNESIHGVKNIRVYGKKDRFINEFFKVNKRHGTTYAQLTFRSMIPKYLFEFIMVLFVVFFVLISIFLGIKDILPAIAMFSVAAVRVIPAANNLTSGLVQLRFNRDAVSRLYDDIVRTKYYEKEKKLKYGKINKFKTLNIDNICFKYQKSSSYALNKINIKINSGESIGIIGISGSGKSTLVDLLLGLLVPSKGKIFFNEKLLDLDNMEAWRACVSYLPQETFLIDNTLKHNVALELDEKYIDIDKVNKSLEKARLGSLVLDLKSGINTQLGEAGVRLSGGQRQRVALARAFYHDRDVLILDEATSALDENNEKEIVEEVKILKRQKTMIIISHRLSTIQYCDRIYRISKGEIIESGSPSEIL